MTDELEPFRIDVDEAALADLRDRLSRTRWPDEEPVGDWSQGVPRGYIRELCRYWETDYDWRSAEQRLNALPQFRTTIDGLAIHFVHVRSPVPDAVPLVLTHGWPGSVFEFAKVIGPLVDPAAHGGDRRDAFDIVCPTLPGFGFSDKPDRTGWGVARIAAAWAVLMARLGYDRYAAQGGDWGAAVSTALAELEPERVVALHLNYAFLSADALHALAPLTGDEQRALAARDRHRSDGGGYSMLQATRPQTLGYGLADSPAGQCAWIIEKFHKWSDCDGHPENAFTRDELLDDITLYWLTNSAASSARIYWESTAAMRAQLEAIHTPTAFSAFPHEIVCFPRRWIETRYRDLRYYNRPTRGGHFAAYEQPELFIEEIRAGVRAIRSDEKPPASDERGGA